MANYYVKTNPDNTVSYGIETNAGDKWKLTLDPITGGGNGKGILMTGRTNGWSGWENSTEEEFNNKKQEAYDYLDLLVP